MGQFRHGNVGIDPYYDARAKIRGDERDARVARVEKAKENAASRITDYEPTDINWKSGYDPEGFQRLYDIEKIKQEYGIEDHELKANQGVTDPSSHQNMKGQPVREPRSEEKIKETLTK